MQIPAHINAGDTVAWAEPPLVTRLGVAVAPSAWSLRFALRGAATGLDVTGTPDGNQWLFSINAAQSAALNTGPATTLWYWQAVGINGTDQVTVSKGVLKVRPNLAGLATTATFDGSSPNEQILAAIDREIKARINGGATLEYTIGQRSLKKESLAVLMNLRTQYRRIVRTERRASKPGFSDLQTIGITFR